MTVVELIKALQALPQDAEIWLPGNHGEAEKVGGARYTEDEPELLMVGPVVWIEP